jgi:hypothetical protein
VLVAKQPCVIAVKSSDTVSVSSTAMNLTASRQLAQQALHSLTTATRALVLTSLFYDTVHIFMHALTGEFNSSKYVLVPVSFMQLLKHSQKEAACVCCAAKQIKAVVGGSHVT